MTVSICKYIMVYKETHCLYIIHPACLEAMVRPSRSEREMERR